MTAIPRTILYTHSSAGRYGADRQLLTLAAGLDPERYRPLAVLPHEGELADDLRAADVEVVIRPLSVLRRADFNPGGLARITGRAAADAAGLGRLARERAAALVHSNTSVILGGRAAAATARVPHVFSVREIYADFARFWPPYRRLLLTSAGLCCSSEATRAQFGDAPQAEVVHEAVTTVVARRANRAQARRELGLEPDAFVCAVLGRISTWKGQDLLARAIAEPALASSGTVALVAGDAWPGEERHEKALRELAARLGVRDRVRLVGFQAPETVYGAADVVVVPSTKPDPLPNSALEASAAGCCLVAAAHGGLTEIVADGETGRLFAPGDAAGLAEVLAELRSDPEQRARLGAAAGTVTPERFSAARLLERTQALYDGLLAGDRD